MGLILLVSTGLLGPALFIMFVLHQKTGDKTFLLGAIFISVLLCAYLFVVIVDYTAIKSQLLVNVIEIPAIWGNLTVSFISAVRFLAFRKTGAITDPVVDALFKITNTLNKIPIRTAYISPEFTFKYANEAFCASRNLSRNNIIGKNVFAPLSQIKESQLRPSLEMALHGEFRNEQIEITQENGTSRHIMLSLVPVVLRKKTTGVFLIEQSMTELFESRLELSRNQAKQVLAADTAGVGYLEWDEAMTLVDVSANASAILSTSKTELLDAWNQSTTAQLPYMLQQFKAILEHDVLTEETTAKQIELRSQSEEVLYLKISTRRYTSLHGDRLLAIIQDVTEEHLTIKKITLNEQRFKDFTQSATDWIWETDSELRMVSVSGGFTSNALIIEPDYHGKTIEELCDFRDEVGHLALRTAMNNKTPFRSITNKILGWDGQLYTLDISGKPLFDEKGAFSGYRGTVFDLTEMDAANEAKKEAQETFAAAFENVSKVVALFDEQDRLEYCNKKYRLIYLDPEIKDPIGKPYEEILKAILERNTLKGGKANALKWANQRRNRRTTPASFERVQIANGDWIEVSDFIFGEGKLLSVGTDITERVKAEDSLRDHQAALQLVDRRETLGQMAAAIAHELNQPLAAISNFASGCVLRAKRGDLHQDDLINVLEDMSEQSNRAGAILRSMSAYMHDSKSVRVKIQFSAILKSAVDLMQTESRARGLTFDCQDETKGAQLDCVPIEIEQLLINLIKNAIEATDEVPTKRGAVTVRAEATPHEITVFVLDTGAGFSGSTDRTAFEPFKTTKEKGLGVGLAICRTIVDSHSGTIAITRSTDSGSTITVTLPTGA